MEKRSYQRRAVYTVLKRWLDEATVLEAVRVFDDFYQDRPSQAIHEYLTQISELYQDQVDIKTLRQSLLQVLLRNTQELEPDPLPTIQRQQLSDDGGFRLNFMEPSEEQLALHELVSSILRKIKPEQRTQMHTHIAGQLRQRFVNGNFDKLAQYLLSDNPQFLASFSQEALQDFFNALYVAACEVLGPVAADQWFAGTLSRLQQSDSCINPEALYHFL